jgi:DNA-directed RNA polymerase subunit H (RpoH/RPB5)
MDTLKTVRQGEEITEYDVPITDKAHIPYLIIAVKERKDNCIIIVTNHSDEIIDIVLNEIDPAESGYLFFQSELDVDPLNNHMVPKHRLATVDELECLKFKHIKSESLPVIKMLDPIRRWLNFARGDVIAIERSDKTDPYFRRVS